ncbi:unnamed protein product [Spodoptera exigua]|nr:unnamed protein product [Spodoptera exigua]
MLHAVPLGLVLVGGDLPLLTARTPMLTSKINARSPTVIDKCDLNNKSSVGIKLNDHQPLITALTHAARPVHVSHTLRKSTEYMHIMHLQPNICTMASSPPACGTLCLPGTAASVASCFGFENKEAELVKELPSSSRPSRRNRQHSGRRGSRDDLQPPFATVLVKSLTLSPTPSWVKEVI